MSWKLPWLKCKLPAQRSFISIEFACLGLFACVIMCSLLPNHPNPSSSAASRPASQKPSNISGSWGSRSMLQKWQEEQAPKKLTAKNMECFLQLATWSWVQNPAEKHESLRFTFIPLHSNKLHTSTPSSNLTFQIHFYHCRSLQIIAACCGCLFPCPGSFWYLFGSSIRSRRWFWTQFVDCSGPTGNAALPWIDHDQHWSTWWDMVTGEGDDLMMISWWSHGDWCLNLSGMREVKLTPREISKQLRAIAMIQNWLGKAVSSGMSGISLHSRVWSSQSQG